MAKKKSPGPTLTSVFYGAVELIPPRWRAKLGLTRVVIEQPTDVGPEPLVTPVVDSSVEQIRTDERKQTTTTLGSPAGVTLTEFVRTPSGQLGSRTVSLVTTGTALPGITALTIDSEQQATGTGYSEQSVTTVSAVFPQLVSSSQQVLQLPEKFRGAGMTIIKTEVTAEGTSAIPTTVGTGSHSASRAGSPS